MVPASTLQATERNEYWVAMEICASQLELDYRMAVGRNWWASMTSGFPNVLERYTNKSETGTEVFQEENSLVEAMKTSFYLCIGISNDNAAVELLQLL
jgi:hypothetical protein